MSLNCSLCKKTFTSKQSLDYHIKHEVCKKLKKCEKCGQRFATKSTLAYHTENGVCEKKKKHVIKLKTDSYEDLSKNALLLKIAHLEGENEALKNNPKTVNNNLMIFPTEFGKENIEKICMKLGDILKPIVKLDPSVGILRLSEKIHKTTEFPEYHNFYTKSEKSNYALVSDGKTFRNKPKKTVIDELIEHKREILNSYFDKNEDNLGKNVVEKYMKYQELLDSDKEVRRALALEIGGLLLDMKEIIANDDKTRQMLKKVEEGHFELD